MDRVFLRAIRFPAEAWLPQRVGDGWLVVYPEGDGPRRVQRIRCAEGQSVHWDPSATAWHIHWYPDSREPGPLRRTVNTRQGQARTLQMCGSRLKGAHSGKGVVVPVRLQGDETDPSSGDDSGVLFLTWSWWTHDTMTPTLPEEYRAALDAAKEDERASQPLWDILEHRSRATAVFARQWSVPHDRVAPFLHAATCAGHRVPLSVFADEAIAQPLVSPAVLQHWTTLAASRLQLPSWEELHGRPRVDDVAELVAEIALTRALASVYMVDRGAHGKDTDDWWFPVESPAPGRLAFDCEDIALEALGVLADLQRLPPGSAATEGWLAPAAAAARQYTFVLAICVMHPGGKGAPTWHAVVLGLPTHGLLARLAGRDTGPPAADGWPVLWLDGTEYTTSNWRRRGCGPVSVEQFTDRHAGPNHGRLLEAARVKAPAEVVEGTHQYTRLVTLVLPEATSNHAGRYREIHLREGQDLGVDPQQFMHAPWTAAWTWERSNGFDPDVHAAGLALRRRWAPRHRLTYTEHAPGALMDERRDGLWPYVLRPSDAGAEPESSSLTRCLLHDPCWTDGDDGGSSVAEEGTVALCVGHCVSGRC